MKKVFLWLIIVSMIAVFSLTGCRTEGVEEVKEETVGEAEEEAVPSSDEMAEEVGTVTDIDGNVYHTVTIGTQVWIVENLKVTHYKNGDPILNVNDDTQWNSLTTEAYSYYDNDSNNADIYGCLYNWYAANDSRNICPTGWHVPTKEEWTILEMYLGESSVAGGKMKETGTIHWKSPNTGATNESGFSALPGGYSGNEGFLGIIGDYGNWWSVTEFGEVGIWVLYLAYDSSDVNWAAGDNNMGFSIRCISD